MNISSVKLVIWDLDETFWSGTLSEGPVSKIEDNITIVKNLVDRGIMNSIVSKNDYDEAIAVLEEWGIKEYFVFPQITWNPKGEMVKQLLAIMKLRSNNVVFVDDNISNLEEVKFYNHGIESIDAKDFNITLLDCEAFKGKSDKEHARLQQYHILEERIKNEMEYSSNTEFLQASNIRICIKNDCMNQIDRIAELVQRTNQLNYTKKRIERDELLKLFLNHDYECKYIRAIDNFGDYGIVGFYVLRNNKLEHFLFSCRVLGFGIENYIYQKLRCPNIDVVREVAVELDTNLVIDWIKEDNISVVSKTKNNNKLKRILMVGGCDLEQACIYLQSEYDIDQEFSTVIDGNEIRTSDTCQLINALRLTQQEKDELCEKIPFFDKKITFGTKIYDEKYDVIVISVVDDFIRGIYEHKIKGYSIGYGGFYDQKEFLMRYSEENLRYLFENFQFKGKEDVATFRNNLITILDNVPKSTKIIMINGIDLDVSDWIGKERSDRNMEMNAVIDDVIITYSNVKLLDMRKIVTSKSALIKHDNRHFDRNVYYKMAQEIALICSDDFQMSDIKIKHKLNVNIKRLTNKIKRILEG